MQRKILAGSEARGTINNWLKRTSFWSAESDDEISVEEERINVIASFNLQQTKVFIRVVKQMQQEPLEIMKFNSSELAEILNELEQQEENLKTESREGELKAQLIEAIALEGQLRAEIEDAKARETRLEQEVQQLRVQLASRADDVEFVENTTSSRSRKQKDPSSTSRNRLFTRSAAKAQREADLQQAKDKPWSNSPR